MVAYENTTSRNVVECGVAEGMTIFFCIANYNKECRAIVMKYSNEWRYIVGRLKKQLI